MNKFKVGDRVRRVRDMHMGMSPGDTATVTGFIDSGSELLLQEYGGSHCVKNFCLADAVSIDKHVLGAKLNGGKPDHITVSRKDDSGKLDMNLLDDMPRALKAVVEVMQWAIVDKQPVPYKRGSWLGVEPDRYRAAIKRHERSAAEQATPAVPARLQRDAETNLLHLAHTACSALMALENVLREVEQGHD